MTFDDFFSRTYHPDNYNCAHFVCEAWETVTGQTGMGEALATFLQPAKARTATLPLRRSFRRLPGPVSPCLALFLKHGCEPHVGIYKEGRIFHIQRRGVEFQPVAVILPSFDKVEYWAFNENRNHLPKSA